MQQSIKDRGGEHVLAKDAAPWRHDLSRGDEQARPFVAPRDELEAEMGAATFEESGPELVDHEQLRFGVEQQAISELAFALSVRECRE